MSWIYLFCCQSFLIGGHQPRERRRRRRHGRVDHGIGLRRLDVPFVEAGAERHRGGDAGGVAGVIGQADRDGRRRSPACGWRRGSADRPASDTPRRSAAGRGCGRRFRGRRSRPRRHFVEARQAGRDHERLAGGRGARDQPVMRDVAAGDLQGVAVETDQHVDGGLVEGTREPGQAVRAGPRGDGAMGRLVQFVAREDVAQRRRVDVRSVAPPLARSGATSVSARSDCSLTADAPAPAAASTSASARAGSPSWLRPISAMTNSGAPPPMARLPMRMRRCRRPCHSLLTSVAIARATRAAPSPVDGEPAAARQLAAPRRVGQQVERGGGRRPAPGLRADAGRAPERRRRDRPARSAGPSSPGRVPPPPRPRACRAHTPRRASSRPRPPRRSPAPARRENVPAGPPRRRPAIRPILESAGRIQPQAEQDSYPTQPRKAIKFRAQISGDRPAGPGLLPPAQADEDRAQAPTARARAGGAWHRPRAPAPRRPLRAGMRPRRTPSPSTRRAPRLPSTARSDASGAIPMSWNEATGTPARRAARSHGVAAASDGSSMTRSARSGCTTASREAGSTSTPRRRAVSVAATVPRIETRGGTPRAPARWIARTRCPKPMRGLAATRNATPAADRAPRGRAARLPGLLAALTSPVRAGR